MGKTPLHRWNSYCWIGKLVRTEICVQLHTPPRETVKFIQSQVSTAQKLHHCYSDNPGTQMLSLFAVKVTGFGKTNQRSCFLKSRVGQKRSQLARQVPSKIALSIASPLTKYCKRIWYRPYPLQLWMPNMTGATARLMTHLMTHKHMQNRSTNPEHIFTTERETPMDLWISFSILSILSVLFGYPNAMSWSSFRPIPRCGSRLDLIVVNPHWIWTHQRLISFHFSPPVSSS